MKKKLEKVREADLRREELLREIEGDLKATDEEKRRKRKQGGRSDTSRSLVILSLKANFHNKVTTMGKAVIRSSGPGIV